MGVIDVDLQAQSEIHLQRYSWPSISTIPHSQIQSAKDCVVVWSLLKDVHEQWAQGLQIHVEQCSRGNCTNCTCYNTDEPCKQLSEGSQSQHTISYIIFMKCSE